MIFIKKISGLGKPASLVIVQHDKNFHNVILCHTFHVGTTQLYLFIPPSVTIIFQGSSSVEQL